MNTIQLILQTSVFNVCIENTHNNIDYIYKNITYN